MKSTSIHINQIAPLNQRVSLRERVSSFIEHHSGVFRALTRHGAPYGGNWMSITPTDSLRSPELTAESMVEVERELDDIILRLSQLNNSLGQSAGSTHQADKRSTGQTNEIGIERFRALRFEA